MTKPAMRSPTILGHPVKVFHSAGPASSDNPAFVLVHGIGMSHRYLARLQGRLSATAATYSLDLPGFGPNPRPEHTLSVEDHAAVVVQALQNAGISRCILVGHSMGAQIVAAAALQAPELAAGVVLIGPVVDKRRRSTLLQAVALAHDSLRESPSANLIVLTDYLRTGVRWYLRELTPMMTYRLEEKVRAIQCPVLVLRGSSDPVARAEWCRELAESAPAGQFREIAGQPHVVQHSAPGAVGEVVEAFAQTVASRAEANQFMRQASATPQGKLED